MDPLWTEIIGKYGLPVAAAIALLWLGSGDKPKWVFGGYHRETLKQRDDQHAAEMARRDSEYKSVITRYEEDLSSERKRSEGWQAKYVGVLETAHIAVKQTVEAVAAVTGKGDG